MSESESSGFKVSCHVQTAGDTAKHNDRSMYEYGYEGRAKNMHYDMYGCGSSVEAEERFYRETFSEALEAKNERAKAKGNFDRVKTLDEWKASNMPKEMIVQLGNKDHQPRNRDDVAELANEAYRQIQAAGGTVISCDVHFDMEMMDDGTMTEVTPHAHIRYVMLSKNKFDEPDINVAKCLREHGIERPEPDAKDKTGKKARDTKYNNPAVTFIGLVRDALEAKAIELGYDLDLDHDPNAKHKTTAQWRREERLCQQREELERNQAELDKQQSQLESNQTEIEEHEELLSQLEEQKESLEFEIRRLDKKKEETEKTVVDLEERKETLENDCADLSTQEEAQRKALDQLKEEKDEAQKEIEELRRTTYEDIYNEYKSMFEQAISEFQQYLERFKGYVRKAFDTAQKSVGFLSRIKYEQEKKLEAEQIARSAKELEHSGMRIADKLEQLTDEFESSSDFDQDSNSKKDDYDFGF